MPFQAIVHAASLRPGARICLSDLAQANLRVAAPSPGDAVTLRIGTCCPQLAGGTVASSKDGCELILRVDGDDWLLRRSEGGVTISGLIADDWLIVSGEHSREPCPD